MNRKYYIIIALFALSFSCVWGQSDRVKTVNTPDSASLVIFDPSTNDYESTNMQEAMEEIMLRYDSVLFVSNNNLTGIPGSIFKVFNSVSEAILYANSGMTKAKIIVIDGKDYALGGITIDTVPINIISTGALSDFLISGQNKVNINARKVENFNLIGNSHVVVESDTVVITGISRTIEIGSGEIFIKTNTVIGGYLIKAAGNGTYGNTSFDLQCIDYFATDGPWLGGGFASTAKYQTINFSCKNYHWNHASDVVGTYQCDLDSTIINFYAENVIPGTGDPGMIYWQPDAGSGPRTSGTILNFHVKNYKGDNEIMEYMNGKSGNAGKINVRIDNYHYTGTGDFFFNNGSTVDLFDTLYITGNYYATVPFFSGGNYAYNTVFRNANIFCNQSGPVILSATGTGQPISIEHSVLSNNGSGPIIDFASAKTIKTHGSYTYGPNQLDAQVFFQKRRELGDYRYNGTAFGTTDGSGDLVVTLPATMPNATYTVLLTPGATTFQNVVTTAQNTTTFTARFFDAAGAAITSTGVVLNWMVIDY